MTINSPFTAQITTASFGNPIELAGVLNLPDLSIPTPSSGSPNNNNIFNALDYGAVPDFHFISDGVMAAGSAVLTSASNPFSLEDVGKFIAVKSAGVVMYSQIITFNNAGSVTLSNVSASSISGAMAEWGADNTQAIQNCIDDAVLHTGTAYIPPFIFMTAPLNLADSTGWTLQGDGINASRLYALPHPSYNAQSGHMLDMTGAMGVRVRNLQIGWYNELTQPATAIACMQTAANQSNALVFEDLYISGYFRKATMYVYGVPSSSMVRCKIYNYMPGAAEVLCYSSENSVYSLTSSFATVTTGFRSTSDWTHFDTELHKFGGNTVGAPLRFQRCADIRFYGGVISGGSAEYVMFNGTCANFLFSGITLETESEPIPVNAIYTDGIITGFTFDQCTYIISGEFLAGPGNIVGTTGGVSEYHLTSLVGAVIPGSSAVYFGLTGHAGAENNVVFICARKGILTQFRANSSASPGAGLTYTYVLRKNNADSVVACSHSNGGVSSNDLGRYVHVSPGDYIAVKFISAPGANQTRAFASFQFIPTG